MSCYSQVPSSLRLFSAFSGSWLWSHGRSRCVHAKEHRLPPNRPLRCFSGSPLMNWGAWSFSNRPSVLYIPQLKKTPQPSSLCGVSSVYAAKKYWNVWNGLEYMTSPRHAKNVKISTSILFAFEKVAPKIPKRWYALIGWPEKDNQGDRLKWTKLYLFSWWFLNSYRHELSECVSLYQSVKALSCVIGHLWGDDGQTVWWAEWKTCTPKIRVNTSNISFEKPFWPRISSCLGKYCKNMFTMFVHPFCMITSGRLKLKIMLVNMILQICIAEQLNRSLLVVSCEGSHQEKVFQSHCTKSNRRLDLLVAI